MRTKVSDESTKVTTPYQNQKVWDSTARISFTLLLIPILLDVVTDLVKGEQLNISLVITNLALLFFFIWHITLIVLLKRSRVGLEQIFDIAGRKILLYICLYVLGYFVSSLFATAFSSPSVTAEQFHSFADLIRAIWNSGWLLALCFSYKERTRVEE